MCKKHFFAAHRPLPIRPHSPSMPESLVLISLSHLASAKQRPPLLSCFCCWPEQDLPLGWEKRLSHAIKMMAGKRHLVHVPGHPGMFKMSKAMVEKQKRKRGPRKVKVRT